MPGLKPRIPVCAQRVQARFDRQQVLKLLGGKLTWLAPLGCESELPFKSGLTRQHGYFHGGIVGTIADSAGGPMRFTLLQTLMTMHARPDS
jgi:acyl-coenzyme A thioesterase PaaI-like protein